IAGAALPEVKKLADYYARGAPIPWVRVNKLPEFTYFPHKVHIRANVKCQTCHGPVETMTTFGAETGPRLTSDLLNLVGLRPAPGSGRAGGAPPSSGRADGGGRAGDSPPSSCRADGAGRAGDSPPSSSRADGAGRAGDSPPSS